MKQFLIASLLLIVVASSFVLGNEKAYATPFAYNQTAISIPWTVQSRSGVTDVFTNNDTHILWAQFNGNLVDSSNYYNNMALTSGSAVYASGSFPNLALNFSGSQGIKINSFSALPVGSQSRTISMWFVPKSFVNGDPLFFYGSTSVDQAFFCQYTGTSGYVICSLFGDDLTSTSPLSLGSSNNLAVTLSGTTMTIYINGIAAGSKTTGTPNTQFNTFFIGANGLGSYIPAGTLVKDFNIFNRAVSPSDILADKNNGVSFPIHPTFITNWYYYPNTGSTLTQRLGTNQASLSLGCAPFFNIIQPIGENISYICDTSGTTTIITNTKSINTYSGTVNGLYSGSCSSSTQAYNFALFPSEQLLYSFCFGNTGVGGTSTGVMSTALGNQTFYNCAGCSGGVSTPNLYQSSQKFTYAQVGGSNPTILFTPLLRFNSNVTSGVDPNISSFTNDLCDLTSMPSYSLTQIQKIGCDQAVSANQIHYLNGTQMLQVNNFYSNNTLPFFSSIQDNPYKSYLTLLPYTMGLNNTGSSAPITDFILYTPSANYMVVLTQSNIYYANIATIQQILAKNYAYQSYLLTTQATTSSFPISHTNLAETFRLYGPSNLNTTVNSGGMFTIPSPYQIQLQPASTSNGMTRIIDPRWTNLPATNYPVVWTPTSLMFPIFLTVSNAPVDAGLMATNNAVTINSTQQTWAVIRLDSTHSGEFDVPAGTCQDLYVADISQKPAVYTYQGSVCATGTNQKTVAYTNSLPLNFYNFPYGATDSFVQSTNTLTTTVRATTVPFTYTETLTNNSGTVVNTATFTANSSPDVQSFVLNASGQPDLLKISVAGNQMFSDYLGSSFSLASTASFFHQYFNYQGFDLLSFIPLIFASMFTSRTSAVGVIMVVVLIASLNLFSIVIIPIQYIFIMSLVGTIALIAGRQIYS